MIDRKIAINCRFLSQPITGVQRFAANMCVELKKIFPNAFFLTPANILDEATSRILEARVVGNCKGHIWEQLDLPRELKKLGEPLLINLANTGPLFYANSIFTLHDIAFVRYPHSFSAPFRTFYKLLVPRLLRDSRLVVTVSAFSKREICDYYSVNPSRVKVVFNAVDERFFSQPSPAKVRPYLLAVSSPNLYKNFERVIRVYSKWAGRGQVDLCIVGSSSSASFAKQDYGQIPNGVKFLGRVNDHELITLYSGASGFIFPSLYEGFGIPPLEAQACGCPVIASTAASIPEVLGDSVLYFDPLNDNDVLRAMDKLISLDADERADLINSGLANAKRYSWGESAMSLAEIIRNELKN